MAENSTIEWTTHTFNAWIGCTPVSPACDNCYAEDLAARYGWAKWGPGEPRKRTSALNWKQPLKWNAAAIAAGTRPRVFSDSLADWADPEVDETWRRDHFEIMRATPQLDWLLLTKRHALALGYLEKYAQGLTNIRVGMTVENQPMADIRLPRLRKIRESGFPTFVSYEPALGMVDWEPWMDAIGWLIAGGESGRRARPPQPDWFRIARDICARFGVPFFFKQWGEWIGADEWLDILRSRGATPLNYDAPYERPLNFNDARSLAEDCGFSLQHQSDGATLFRVGKKRAGATLDGREHREFPR